MAGQPTRPYRTPGFTTTLLRETNGQGTLGGGGRLISHKHRNYLVTASKKRHELRKLPRQHLSQTIKKGPSFFHPRDLKITWLRVVSWNLKWTKKSVIIWDFRRWIFYRAELLQLTAFEWYPWQWYFVGLQQNNPYFPWGKIRTSRQTGQVVKHGSWEVRSEKATYRLWVWKHLFYTPEN